jgi:hypothetical protein
VGAAEVGAWGVDFLFFDNYLFRVNAGRVVMLVVVVVVMTEGRSVDWVSNAFGNTLDTATEGMILSVVVVIAHITLVFWCVNGSSCRSFYANFFLGITGWVYGRAGSVLYGVFCLLGSEVLSGTSEAGRFFLVEVSGSSTETVLSKLGYNWPGSLTELAFVGVESGLESGSWSSNDASFTVVGGFLSVGPVRNVELSFDVSGVGCLVSVGGEFDQ